MGTRLNSVPGCFADTLVYDFAISSPAITKTGRTQAYQLRQVSFDVQKLVPSSGNCDSLGFVIKLQNLGPIKAKKPHTIITKHFGGDQVPFAEIRLNPGSHGTTIWYTETSYAQMLSAHPMGDGGDRSQTCAIGGEQHVWRPLGPSQLVLELVNAAVERVAIFVHPEQNFVKMRQSIGWGKEQELGELHILQHIDVTPRSVDEIIGSAIAVIGQGKRRASV